LTKAKSNWKVLVKFIIDECTLASSIGCILLGLCALVNTPIPDELSHGYIPYAVIVIGLIAMMSAMLNKQVIGIIHSIVNRAKSINYNEQITKELD